jgi:ABC-type lipoprotein release transport system permease subunit
MRAFIRGLRNVYRSKVRFALVMAILGLAAGVSITMAQVAAGIAENLGIVASDYLALLEVRKAGADGMGVGADALPEEVFEKARTVPHAVKTEKYLFQRMIYPERAASISIVVGLEPEAAPRLALHGELNRPRILAGRWLTPQDRGAPRVVAGQSFANFFGLRPGSRFVLRGGNVAVQDRPGRDVTVEDIEVEVVGVFEAGFVFGDNQLFIPLDVAQRFSKQAGKITHIYVTAASVDKVEAVEEGLRQAFGDEADVISGQALAQSWAKALSAIRMNSLAAGAVALAAAALVVLFTMILVTRERTREIGVLKALGADNASVARQFLAESLGVALIGGGLGLALFAVGGPRIANVLLGLATSSLTPATAMGGETPAQSLVLPYDLSWISLAAAFGVVALLTLVGSLYAVAKAVSLRPVDAMRAA